MASGFSMAETAANIEFLIRNNRLMQATVDWQDELIFPYYDGLSIYNLSQTILHQLTGRAEAPLNAEVWGDSNPSGQIKRVVHFLTDGLGYRLLQEFMEHDAELYDSVAEITDGRGPVPLTSTSPSTTAVALPTFWSSHVPGRHGMLGTSMYLKQFLTVADMLRFKPLIGDLLPGILEDWGANVEEVIPVKTLVEQLLDHQVPTHLLLDRALLGTGLSRIMHRGVAHQHVHGGSLDMWLRVEDVLKETRGQSAYVNIYWPVIDMVSHIYGANTKYVFNEVKHQMKTFASILKSKQFHDGQTLFMIVADHGHYDAPNILYDPDRTFPPELANDIRGFAGDVRFTQLFLRTGTKQRVMDFMRIDHGNELAVLDTEQAINAGLFGPNINADLILSRLGDVIVVSRQGTRFNEIRGRVPVSIHAGMSDWEMMVPFLWKVI